MAPWRQSDLTNRVRNMIRRGYLLETYSDGKLMKGRVKTGVGIENDKIDIVHPVGYVSRLPAGEKVEVITVDVNGDPSKRVVLAVIGDRATHPKVDEGEAVLYQPGKPERIMRVNGSGISIDGHDQPINMKTQKAMNLESGEPFAMKSPGYTWDGPQTFNGDVVINGNLTVNGNITVSGTVFASHFVET